MPIPRITKGSIEHLPIRVIDALDGLGTLTGKDLRWWLYLSSDEDNTNPIINNASAQNDGEIALPLIDTTTLARDKYKVFIGFQNLPQTPKLGPFEFLVVD